MKTQYGMPQVDRQSFSYGFNLIKHLFSNDYEIAIVLISKPKEDKEMRLLYFESTMSYQCLKVAFRYMKRKRKLEKTGQMHD